MIKKSPIARGISTNELRKYNSRTPLQEAAVALGIRDHIPKGKYMISLRRWSGNSHRTDGDSPDDVGGGYVLLYDQNLIVIDPGHDFSRVYGYMKFRPMDIDAILVTHYHPDHVGDLNGKLYTDLRDVYDDTGKIVTVICNKDVKAGIPGTPGTITTPHLVCLDIEPNIRFSIIPHSTFKIKAVQVKHRQMVPPRKKTSVDDCYGFILYLKARKIPKIGITGDTQWFDDLPNRFADVKMLFAHIGSDGKSENHLNPKGVLGLAKNIDKLETLVITEFDYEAFGKPEKKRINETTKISQNLKTNGRSIEVIPSDLGLRIDLETNKIFIKCESCSRKFLSEFVKCKPNDDKPLWIDINKVEIEEEEDKIGRGLIYKVRKTHYLPKPRILARKS